MRLLVVEPQASGHHLALYTRHVIRAAVKRGWDVSLMTTEVALAHPAMDLLQSEVDRRLRVHLMQEVPVSGELRIWAQIKRQMDYYYSMQEAYRRVRKEMGADIIYVINLDLIDKVVGLLGSPFDETPFAGMLMSIKFHRHDMGVGPQRRSDLLYRWLFKRLTSIARLRFVAVVDEAFDTYVRRASDIDRQKIRFVPDVGHLSGAETHLDARNHLGIAAEDFTILVYGSLTARKGVSELLRAVQVLRDPRIRVLVAGVQDPKIRRLFDETLINAMVQDGSIIIIDRFLTDAEEYRVFRCADAVWLGYVEGFTGSSGVLYQAGSVGVPVIASKHGLLGWLTERHRVGLTIEPTSEIEVSAAIKALAGDRNLRQDLGRNGRRMAVNHTPSSFGATICDALGG